MKAEENLGLAFFTSKFSGKLIPLCVDDIKIFSACLASPASNTPIFTQLLAHGSRKSGI